MVLRNDLKKEQTMDIIEFTVPYGDEELTFKLHPMKRKAAMRNVHVFLGALRSNNLDITTVDFDVLEKISNDLFAKGFVVLTNGDSKEITDHSDFFYDKVDVWYSAITEGIKANCKDFFSRSETN
jgi:hypothetical protein